MSRGFGWVQWACLWIIGKYEERGERPTTFNIAADVYQVKPDKHGNRWVSDAQHVAVKRALEGLQRKGQVIGFRDTLHTRAAGDGLIELCHYWMTEQRAQQWLHSLVSHGSYSRALIERVRKKMLAIGMKPPK